ncbi:hypothetical protein HAX54_052283, partial [Datura stramonium]|nr:hypothetical protein [Datura stramonium]
MVERIRRGTGGFGRSSRMVFSLEKGDRQGGVWMRIREVRRLLLGATVVMETEQSWCFGWLPECDWWCFSGGFRLLVRGKRGDDAGLVFHYCCFDRKLWRREGEGKEKGKGSGGVYRSFGCSSENGSGGDGERDQGRGTRLK